MSVRDFVINLQNDNSTKDVQTLTAENIKVVLVTVYIIIREYYSGNFIQSVIVGLRLPCLLYTSRCV